MNNLTETEKAYLAGFLDADGCINLASHEIPGGANVNHYLQVNIAQANGPFLEKWCKKVGLGKVYEIRGNCESRKKKHYHWTIGGPQAEALLKQIVPFLDIKSEDAEIALMFRKTKHGRTGGCHGTPRPIVEIREQYKQMLHAVKQNRGEPVEKPPEVQEYEQLINSQLPLFNTGNN